MSPEIVHGLRTPPMEEKMSMSSRKSPPKSLKPPMRGAKRQQSTKSQESSSGVPEGKHRRVWKACERCRMKKTKVSPQPVLTILMGQTDCYTVRWRITLQEM